MQRTVTPSGKPYTGSNPVPSTTSPGIAGRTANHGRTAFRRNFPGPLAWRDRTFDTRQLDVYPVREDDDWLVITILVKFF